MRRRSGVARCRALRGDGVVVARKGRADTEELRQAFVHYRALFADLLVDPGAAHGALHGAGVRA